MPLTSDRPRRLACLSLLVAALGLPTAGQAQTVTGTLKGTAADSSGGVLPGVTVAIRSTETGYQRDLVTNERGYWSARFIPLGRYRVTASLSGFGPVVHDRVDVRLNDTRVVNFVLNPRVAEEVTVTADRPQIN